jgi:membrane peptidoglycan carboxypeptidase
MKSPLFPRRVSAELAASPVSTPGLLSTMSDRLFKETSARHAAKFARTLGLPLHLVRVILLVEDKRFGMHFGVDPLAILRAIFGNIRGHRLQGASTISQQVFDVRRRNRGFPRERTINRKIFQSLAAFAYTLRTSKAGLLEEYLQNVYWGRGYIGVGAAAKGYLGKEIEDLSVEESVFLAERLACPNGFSTKRVEILLGRPAIRQCIFEHGGTLKQVFAVYESAI